MKQRSVFAVHVYWVLTLLAWLAPGAAYAAPTDAGVLPAASVQAPASAAPPEVGAPTVSASTVAPQAVSPPDGPRTTATCVEHVPEGKTRPTLSEAFPSRGLSGHVALLRLTVTHGKGERVLTDTFNLQRDSSGARALRQSGFEFPLGASPAAPRVKRTERETDATTTIEIPVIPLPKEPGRHELTLPPLPLAMARASGEVLTLCSSSHPITVDDPTANHPNASPKDNAGPLRQQELWVGLRNVVYGALVGLGLALLIALLVVWWRKRPKPVIPPPPPRPPWERALEALHDIRHADLVAQGRLTAHLERVNHVLREYLGERYGFDGLESTTEEVLASLQRSSLPAPLFVETETMLRESDLVKFADAKPTEVQCTQALDGVESIVRRTMRQDAGTDQSPSPPARIADSAQPPTGEATPASVRRDALPPGATGDEPKE